MSCRRLLRRQNHFSPLFLNNGPSQGFCDLKWICAMCSWLSGFNVRAVFLLFMTPRPLNSFHILQSINRALCCFRCWCRIWTPASRWTVSLWQQPLLVQLKLHILYTTASHTISLKENFRCHCFKERNHMWPHCIDGQRIKQKKKMTKKKKKGSATRHQHVTGLLTLFSFFFHPPDH